MGRSPCCSKEGLNRGAWTATEDKTLTDYIKVHGEGKWRNIPKEAGLKRCGKSCRLRWLNYLSPDIKRGNITQDEEDLIIRLHKLLGNRWSLIAGRLPGRTDNEIKNYWNSNLSKKAQGKQSNNSKIHKEQITRQFDEAPSQGLIRAKGVRCTEALVTPEHHKVVNHDTKVTMTQSMDPNLVKNVVAKSECSEGSLSLSSMEENSSELMMDFNVGETSLSEILDSDFKLCDFGYINNMMQGDGTNNGCKAQLPHFSGQAFLLPEEMMENWSGSDCVQANMDSDFGAFASFLESAEEWMI